MHFSHFIPTSNLWRWKTSHVSDRTWWVSNGRDLMFAWERWAVCGSAFFCCFTCDCWNCEFVFSPFYYDVRCIFLLERLFQVYWELAVSQLRQLLFRLFRLELDLWLLSDRYADMSHADLSDWGVKVSGINCWSKYRMVPLKCWWFYQNF